MFAALLIAASPAAFIGATPIAAEELTPAFETLTSEQLVRMLKDKDFALVNVHIPYEGEIERTDAFIPFDEIASHLAELPADKDAAIVLYCKSGRMSEIAAAELAALGYTRVSHLSGGMLAWAESRQAVIHK